MKTDSYIPRHLENYAFDENLIGRHIVFLAGPRQVGKTRLARNWLEKNGFSELYFNWDDIKTRQAYRTDSPLFSPQPVRWAGPIPGSFLTKSTSAIKGPIF